MSNDACGQDNLLANADNPAHRPAASQEAGLTPLQADAIPAPPGDGQFRQFVDKEERIGLLASDLLTTLKDKPGALDEPQNMDKLMELLKTRMEASDYAKANPEKIDCFLQALNARDGHKGQDIPSLLAEEVHAGVAASKVHNLLEQDPNYFKDSPTVVLGLKVFLKAQVDRIQETGLIHF